MYALPKLVFATNNSNKLTEVRDLLAGIYEVVSLDAIGFHDDIEEPYDTFRQNAWTKANTVFQQTGYDCFAEDTGLVIDALGGEPGVRSARYAGEGRNSTDNMHLVLDKMQGQTNRSAHFITVIALHLDRQMSYFEGIAEGTITLAPMGGSGFGYDPIFMPNGYNTTFAEMPKSEKNRISHRAKAIEQLIMYLKSRHKR